MSPAAHKQKGRINLRVDPDQEARLRAAAEANGESLTGFLLAAGAERAEAVLERAGRIALSASAFEQFVAALDNEAEPMPTLRRYVTEPSLIPSR
jgi:uncharacterized protein (DUF1778 family)